MTSKDIEYALAILKPDARGAMRNKNRAIDLIYSHHLKDIDNLLGDIRVFVLASSSRCSSVDELMRNIDTFLTFKKEKS